MKKDKDWLSEQVGELDSTDAVFNESGLPYIDTVVSIERVFDLIYQLDEPEALSQEFINEKAVEIYVDTADAEVHVVFRMLDLQNLIVPKQDGPVVPSWFDEWWKDVTKGGGNLFHNIERFYDELFSSGTREMYNYISDSYNKKKLLDIIVNELDYVVEEEQKYYVINNDQRMMLVRMMDGKTITEADPFKLEDMHEVEKKSHRLTEQEIKDYDTRYFAFAVPVEEVE